MACSTCHVIVDPADFAKLPAASEEEEDLLDLAAHAGRTSRLACQIILTAGHEEPERPHSSRARPTGWGVSRALVFGRQRIAVARILCIAAIGVVARHAQGEADRFQLLQGEPARARTVEELEPGGRGLPELAECDRPVEVRVGGGNRLGNVEKRIARAALQPINRRPDPGPVEIVFVAARLPDG